jgi:large subunit ribosomal protein L4
MVVPMYNIRGEKVGEVELRSDIFEVSINVPLMHQALVRQLANARQGTHMTKSRGEVNRTKAKWYRQKGTGRARHGSRNANLFVGGGVAHGPKSRKYVKKMPRKMRRAALRSALSVKAMEKQIVVPEQNESVEKSARNLPQVKTLRASYLNVRDLLGHDHVLVPLGALQVIESMVG